MSIALEVTSSVPDRHLGSTRLSMTVDSATGLSKAVFVYQLAEDGRSSKFVAVATLAQLASLPEGVPAVAAGNQSPFFRLDRLTLDFPSLEDCDYYAQEISSDLQFLIREARRASSQETTTLSLS